MHSMIFSSVLSNKKFPECASEDRVPFMEFTKKNKQFPPSVSNQFFTVVETVLMEPGGGMFIPYGRLQKAFLNQKCTEKIIKDKLGEAGG